MFMLKLRMVVALVALMTSEAVFASTNEARPTAVFMRHKLTFSQGILEGLTLEKFDLVVTNALMLRDMSITNAFTRLQNPDYEQKLKKFQARVDRLVKAGKEHDLERGFQVYSEVIESCVACHKQYRREQFVEGQLSDAKARK